LKLFQYNNIKQKNYYGFASWNEPLRPALIFLQSCLALHDHKAQPLLERGAVGVVGSSTRIYSATGGAFSLAYFNALLYDGQSLGGSLRHAKNFLAAYAQLKERRLGDDARMTAANLRSSWAFTLWGDPAVRLPQLERLADASSPHVRHEYHHDRLLVQLPDIVPESIHNDKYESRLPANGRLAGLLARQQSAPRQFLVPLVFVEVAMPDAPDGRIPELRGKLSTSRWIFTWDARRKTGYLLALPRSDEGNELRFQVRWVQADLALSHRRGDAADSSSLR
jgi:hypothetical protein